MFGSVMLDVVAAMAFLYLIMSLACSTLNELITSVLRMRAKDLAAGVGSLVGGRNIQKKLYEHPLIKSLVPPSSKKIRPSYVTSRTFALALLDHLAQEGAKPGAKPAPGKAEKTKVDVEQIRAGLVTVGSPQLTGSLEALIREAGEDVKALQAGVERWFNDTMDRAGGWYKRKVQTILLGLAVVITLGLNADTIMIGNALIRDATLRATVVAAAEQYTHRPAPDSSAVQGASLDGLRAELADLQLPIGWSYESQDPAADRDFVWWLTKILGLALTALAVSLGAPFWFDVLNRVTKLRGSGSKPPAEQAKPAPAAR